MMDKLAVSRYVPMVFTTKFRNHNGRHWWVWWVQWRGRWFPRLSGGHRMPCCDPDPCKGVCEF